MKPSTGTPFDHRPPRKSTLDGSLISKELPSRSLKVILSNGKASAGGNPPCIPITPGTPLKAVIKVRSAGIRLNRPSVENKSEQSHEVPWCPFAIACSSIVRCRLVTPPASSEAPPNGSSAAAGGISTCPVKPMILPYNTLSVNNLHF